MQWWYDLSDIVRNLGLVLGAAVGIFIAWRRVQAANKQAEAQIRQAALGGGIMWRSYSIARSDN
jgi:hypothetical protein